jgi:hypothetical protein
MIRFVRRLGFSSLSLACVLVLGWPHVVRTSVYRVAYPLVSVDRTQLDVPPEALVPLGYVLDDPADLLRFHAIAAPAVAGLTSDPARLRSLADLIYSYHPSNDPFPIIPGGRERGVRAILSDIQAGGFALCGHKTMVLAALWRSLGGDVRQIRFTSSDEIAWLASHYGIEVFDRDLRKWFYYDATMNGYAVSADGTPLTLVELNESLALGGDVTVVTNPTRRDWGPDEFLRFLRQNQLQVYGFNSKLRDQDPDRRFGALHFGYALLSRLPRPLDRVVDAVTGDAGRRYVVRPNAAAPAPSARLRVIASPIAPAPSR